MVHDSCLSISTLNSALNRSAVVMTMKKMHLSSVFACWREKYIQSKINIFFALEICMNQIIFNFIQAYRDKVKKISVVIPQPLPTPLQQFSDEGAESFMKKLGDLIFRREDTGLQFG